MTKRFSNSRRAFLKKLSAFLALPGVWGIQVEAAAESPKAAPTPDTARTMPRAACRECSARFCRHKV